MTDHFSFDYLKNYINIINRETDSVNPKFIVIGTKSDLKDQRQVSNEEIFNFVNTYHTSYIEISSNDNLNVDQAMEQILSLVVFGKLKYKEHLYNSNVHSFQNVKNQYLDINYQFK